MDFAPTINPEQAAFREEVRTWINAHAPRIEGEADTPENYKAYRDFGAALGAKGWLYPTYPKEYGGGGLNFEQSVVIHEEMDRLGLGLPPYYSPAGSLGGPCVLVWGTEEQKQRLLKPFVTGQVAGWIALTGPENGSDLAGTQMDAIRDGDDYVINGTKIYIGGSHIPEYMWTFVRTDPTGPRHRNVSWFMIPTNLPGISIRRMDLLGDGGEGIGAGVKNTIYFENVRVPAANLVGGENNGWQVAGTHLELEHGGGGAVRRNTWVSRSIQWAKTERRNGRPLIDDEEARDRLADVFILTEVSRLFDLRNYWMNRTRQKMTYEGSQSSYYRKVTGLDITTALQDLFGPASLVSSGSADFSRGALDHYHRGSITALHPGGTADVQKVLMARRIGAGRDEAESAARTHE